MDGESTTQDNPHFAPIVVGHTESHRARVAIAHDETRQELAPGLHQDSQNVLLSFLHLWSRRTEERPAHISAIGSHFQILLYSGILVVPLNTCTHAFIAFYLSSAYE